MAKAMNHTIGQKEKSDRQIRIQNMRDELNRQDAGAVPVFTRYKNITYLVNVVCPPYGLYRIWRQGSEFSGPERFVQTAVCILIMLYFVSMRYHF